MERGNFVVLNCCLSRDKPAVTWVGVVTTCRTIAMDKSYNNHTLFGSFILQETFPSFSEEGFDLWIRQWVSGGSSSKGHGGIFPVLDILAIVSINA